MLFRLAEAVILVGVFAIAGWLLVPCHRNTIWADVEFTGWVGSIANRIGDGRQLYTDGLHFPMAPLPFVLMHVAFGQHAIWLNESLVNFIAQATAILVLFLAMRSQLPSAVAFLAAFATVPLFLVLPKSLAYDALVQAMVAIVAACALATLTRPTRGAILMLAAASALALVTKQNTGIGATIGAAGALLLCSTAPLKVTIGRAALYSTATALALLIVLVAMTPWIDLRGFLVDVVVTGSEPKGGAASLAGDLLKFLVTLVGRAAIPSIGFPAALGAFLVLRRTDARRPLVRALADVGAVAAAATAIVLVVSRPYGDGPPLYLVTCAPIVGCAPGALLTIGLVVGGLLSAVVIARRTSDVASRALAILTVVTFPAALFHSLSVSTLRWTYDNNPLMQVALAAVLLATFRGGTLASGYLRRLGPILTVAAVFALEITTWMLTVAPVKSVRACRTSWADVPYLAGALMVPGAEKYREVVHSARLLAPAPRDTILVLPEDPSFQAWFDRPRPALASAIIFPDQYWPRLVEEDLARLTSDPPRVVVIGPTRWWAVAGNVYSPAAKDLIDRVRTDLLPRFYEPARIFAVPRADAQDTMEIYALRRDWVPASKPNS